MDFIRDVTDFARDVIDIAIGGLDTVRDEINIAIGEIDAVNGEIDLASGEIGTVNDETSVANGEIDTVRDEIGGNEEATAALETYTPHHADALRVALRGRPPSRSRTRPLLLMVRRPVREADGGSHAGGVA